MAVPDGAFEGDGWPILERRERCWQAGTVGVIIPQAKLHKRYKSRAVKAVNAAWRYSPGPFSRIEIRVELDEDGNGPGYTRNRAIEAIPNCDWYFFVDCDDLPKPHCFEAMNYVGPGYDSVFGMTERRRRIDEGEKPYMYHTPRSFVERSWRDWMELGFYGGGGEAMGMFVRGDLARKIKWLEDLKIYEDLEYFVNLRAHGTRKKLPFPLVTVDELSVSTDKGVSAREHRPWRVIVDFWSRHGMKPLDPDVLEFRNKVRKAELFYGIS